MDEATLREAMLDAWRRHEDDCFARAMGMPKLAPLPPLRTWPFSAELTGFRGPQCKLVVRYQPLPEWLRG